MRRSPGGRCGRWDTHLAEENGLTGGLLFREGKGAGTALKGAEDSWIGEGLDNHPHLQ